MGLIWTLKKTMVLRRDLYRPSDLRAALAEHAGVRLSLPAIGSLINKQPEALRLRTIQAICNTLNTATQWSAADATRSILEANFDGSYIVAGTELAPEIAGG